MPTDLQRILAAAEVSVEFEDRREEELIRTAVVGEDVHEWLTTTSAGSYVLGAALHEQSEIEAAMARTPLWRKRRHRDLRDRHAAIGNAIRWLAEAVLVGMDAKNQLEAETVRE